MSAVKDRMRALLCQRASAVSLSSDAIIERYDSAAKYSRAVSEGKRVGRDAEWHGPDAGSRSGGHACGRWKAHEPNGVVAFNRP